MGTNFLLVGGGAREHILAQQVRRNPSAALYAAMPHRNPGIAALAKGISLTDHRDIDALVRFALACEADLAFIGPEAWLAAGAVDALEAHGIPCVGPAMRFARLETSKAFARELLENYGIPGNPAFRVFTQGAHSHEIAHYLDQLAKRGGYVVKADGLHGGKGVKVGGEHLGSDEEAIAYALECIATDGRVVVEQKLEGEEFSLMAFADGAALAFMPCVQDHKRAHEGDTGPQTGGMGSYSDADHSLPFLTGEDLAQAQAIMGKTCAALREEVEGTYRGVLYGGFMATRDDVRLIEYNTRLGDPEAMNALSLLETDFLETCQAIVAGTLAQHPVCFSHQATVCKYVVPEGYPERPTKGEIRVAQSAPAQRYDASVSQDEGAPDGAVLRMEGSRAVASVGVAATLAQAERIAEQGAQAVKGDVFHRADIGTAALIEKRCAHMRRLRA